MFMRAIWIFTFAVMAIEFGLLALTVLSGRAYTQDVVAMTIIMLITYGIGRALVFIKDGA